MKVLYDHQAFTFQRFGGVSKCFCELISNMPNNVEAIIAVKESDNVHLRESHLIPEVGKPTMGLRIWKQMFPFRGSGAIYRSLQNVGLLSTMEKKTNNVQSN